MRSSWESKNLGELCLVIAGQSPEGKNYNQNGQGIAFYQGKKEFGEKFLEKPSTWTIQITKVARAGDILMSVRAPVGPVNFCTGEVCIGRGLAAIRTNSKLDQEFLFYQLRHLQPNISGTEGAVFASISKFDIESLSIDFPSLPEQQRIVGILDEAFDGIATAKANAEKNVQNARALFESHLHLVFTARDSSHTLRQLSDVCAEITVGHVGSMASQYQYEGIPFLRSQNIRPFFVSLENVVYIDQRFHRSLAKSQLKPGDVAIVRTGYPGTAAVIPESLPVSNCSDLVIVRPGPLADPHYLALFFNSRLGKELVAGRLVGAAQKHFNVKAAKQVVISFPAISEQRRLVTKIDEFRIEVQGLESVYKRKIDALNELKKSLLHQAFSGNL